MISIAGRVSSFRSLVLGSLLGLSHCGTSAEGNPAASGDPSAQGTPPELPERGPARLEGLCPELRSPLDDPSVRELALERGITLEQVLARVTGEFRSTLRWPAPGGEVTVAPESGDVPLTIRVSYEGGAASYLDGVVEGDPPGTEVLGCPDRAEVELAVELETDGGALHERFDAFLSMQQRIGQIVYRGPRRSLGGSLSLAPPPPEGLRQTVLGPDLDYFFEVSELGTSGGIGVIAREFTDGVDTTEVPVDSEPLASVASWPAVFTCSLPDRMAPVDRSIDGVSLVRISQSVAAQSIPFRWADGRETILVLTPQPSAPSGCAREDGGVFHWWFDVDVSASTADGVLNGPLSGSVHLAQYPDRVVAAFSLDGAVGREALATLLPTSTQPAGDYDSGFVDFDVSHTFAWPSEQLIGSEGRLSVVVAPKPACESEECDIRFTLAEGQVPAAAAPPELD
ncbi:MAG TPA: hypothetical protein VMG12_06905 [Polyangiaceae bacterium]|nr:hypothetical protein [Polyangiaceae bacterium]